jgi:hypothetical protein
MAVEFTAATSVQEIGGDGVVSLSHTATGTNRGVFAGVSWSNALAGDGSTSMTYAGNAMTEMWDLLHSTAAGVQNAGYRLAGDANIPTGAQTVTSDLVSAEPTRVFLGVISMQGVDGTTPVGTAATAEGTAGPATVTVGSVTATDMVVDNLGVVQAGGMPTVGAGQTLQWDEEHVGNAQFAGGSTQLGSDGGVMSWTMSAEDFWLIGAVAFKAAASGPTIPELAAARAYGQMPTILPPSMRASGMRMGGPKTERIR